MYVTVAYIVICGEHIQVSCYTKSGIIFINGKLGISHKSVRETLEWYLQESNGADAFELCCQQINDYKAMVRVWS